VILHNALTRAVLVVVVKAVLVREFYCFFFVVNAH
jgi:hypothetical protein